VRRLALALLAAAPAFAHEFWIEPSTFRPAAGETLALRFFVGDGFPGEPYARNPARIREFVAFGEGGAVPVEGVAGRDPAGELHVGADLPRLVGYRSHHSRVVLDAARFEQYLREVGLETIIEKRAARGESKRPGREAYARCAKAILGGPGGGFERALGHPLELIPTRDPCAGPDIEFRLQLDGVPAEGLLVRAFCKDMQGDPLRARTDAAGRVRFALPRAGVWMLSAVAMREAAPALNADWESLWASVLCQVTFPQETGERQGPPAAR